MEPSLPAESYLRTRMKFGIKLGLERIKRMLALAGNPQDAFQSVLIAGTNGKGSVAHLMARILFEAGHRVGLYTSPHLVSYRERMRINGCAIDMDSFNSLLSWAREIAERIERDEGLDPPTEFELLTLMACQHFANNGVEFAIMEVGLGGRFDATNALTPVLSIVTTVSLDHTDRLGSTHFDIATEKLGITRPGVPLVTGERKPAILDYIQRHCIAHGISMRVVGIDVRWQKRWARYDGVCADYVTWCAEYPELECALGGDFQFANVGCALGAVEILRECGIAVSTDAIYRGVARARCVGRLDVLQQKPVVVADGAHNPAAATSLSRALRTLFTYERLALIIGVMQDKDVMGILQALVPLADIVFVTQANTPRALAVRELSSRVKRWQKPVREIPKVPDALTTALKWAHEDDLICVTGSIYVIGELPCYRERALAPV